MTDMRTKNLNGNSNGTVYLRRSFINLLFLIALFALIFINALSFFEIYNFIKANNWVIHSYEVMQANNKTILELLDAETHQRGYVITGDPEFVKNFNARIESINQNLNHAKQLTVDNPEQQATLNQIESLLKQRISMLQDVIKLKQAQRIDTPQGLALIRNGEKITDQIEQTMNKSRETEYSLLKQRNKLALYTLHRVAIVMIVVSVASILFFLFAYFLFNRQLKQRFREERKRHLLETQLSGIIKGADMLAAIDMDSRYIVFNDSYGREIKRAFGVSIAVGMSLAEMKKMAKTSVADYLKNWQKSLAGEEFTAIHPLSREDTGNIYEITSSTIRNENDEMIGATHIIRNVTQRIQKEHSLRELNKNLANEKSQLQERNKKISLLVEMGDAMQACKTQREVVNTIGSFCGKILDFSKGILYVMHPSKDSLEAMTTWNGVVVREKNITPDECWGLRRSLLYQVSDPKTELECEHTNYPELEKNSYVCMPLLTQNNIFGLLYLELPFGEVPLIDNRRLLVIAVAEASALALANASLRETLRSQSIHDPLTGLYNRRYLEEFLSKQLSQAKRKNTPIAIFVLDIDHFKIFNDTYGHEGGDLLLKELGVILQEEIRAGDIACRYGGEEFVILLYDADREIAKQRADDLRRVVAKLRVKYHEQQLGQITISLGVAIYPENGFLPNELIETADKALYEAKRSGRNKVVFYSDINSI